MPEGSPSLQQVNIQLQQFNGQDVARIGYIGTSAELVLKNFVHGGFVELIVENAAGAEETLLRASNLAAGGVLVNNTLTGSGFERVLTTSDLGTGSPVTTHALDDHSDVVLAGAADNDMLYRSGGNWIDTAGGLTWDGSTLVVTGDVQAADATGPIVVNEAATAINPTLIPNRGNLTTGVGGVTDKMSFIVEGQEIARIQAGSPQQPEGHKKLQFIIGPTPAAGGGSPFISFPGSGSPQKGFPTLAFGTGDYGFWKHSNTLNVGLAGIRQWQFVGDQFRGGTAGVGPVLYNEVPTTTNPTVNPNQNDDNTGLGIGGLDALSLIAGAAEIARFTAVGFAPDSIDLNAPTINIGAGSPSIASIVTGQTTVGGSPISTTTIASHSIGRYRSVEFKVQSVRGNDFHSTNVVGIHGGSPEFAEFSEYGSLQIPSFFGSPSAGSPNISGASATYVVDVSGGNMRLRATSRGGSGTITFKVISTLTSV